MLQLLGNECARIFLMAGISMCILFQDFHLHNSILTVVYRGQLKNIGFETVGECTDS